MLESLVSLAIRDYFCLPCFAHPLKPCGKWKKNISISEGTLLIQISCKSARKVHTITKTRPKTKTREKRKHTFLGLKKERRASKTQGATLPPSGNSASSHPLQFSSVQSLSRVWLLATPWITARQASLSITNSRSSLRLTSIESVMPSSHLILFRPLLLLPLIPPSIRVFSCESPLHMRWPKYWSFSFSIIPSKEIPGLISLRMDWLDLLAVILLHWTKTAVPQLECFGWV